MPPQSGGAVDRTATQVLTIAVPASTQWQAATAQQVAVSLFSLPVPLSLIITARPNEIRWTVEVVGSHQDEVINTLYAHYPQAQVIATPKREVAIGYYQYNLHTSVPFFAPLNYASNFGKIDPLASVVEAMTNLKGEEHLIYQLLLIPVREDYASKGDELIKTSQITWRNFMSFDNAMSAWSKMRKGTDKRDKYRPEIQKVARQKLGMALREVSFSVKIKANSSARAQTLAGLILPALAPFGRDSFNLLLPADKGTYPPILAPPEVAALWHLPSQQCQAAGIVWASEAVAPLPRALVDQTHGVILGVNQHQGRAQEVRLSYPDRVTHVSLIGRTRVGKSTLLAHLAHQDITAGKAVGVIDPHGDLVQHLLATSIPFERERDVVLFDVGDRDYPIGLNLLTGSKGVPSDAIAGQALAVIRKLFAENWSATRMEDALYAAL